MEIKEIWNSKDENIWKIALEEYNTNIDKKILNIENEITQHDEESLGNLTPNDWFELLQKYFEWKYSSNKVSYSNRVNDLGKNELTTLYTIKNYFLHTDKKEIEKNLQILIKISGLGISGASGLLALLYPEIYGTVDQFVIKSLDRTCMFPELEYVDPKCLSTSEKGIRLIIHIIEILQEKANELNTIFKTEFWNPRKIDIILWKHRI